MIKKVVIAAAGQGIRMLHLTRNKSKHLINLQKKPFLGYLLDNLIKAGYKDLILIVGYKEEATRNFLKKYKYNIQVINQFKILKREEYGTLCPLKCVKDIIKENFLMVTGDSPKKYVGNLINTGLYKFTPEIFDKISKVRRSPRGEYELTDAITLLAKEKKVKIKKIKDYWLDFGNPADILKVSRFLKNELSSFSTNK